jgi:AmmeMemoRadiSam system protein A
VSDAGAELSDETRRRLFALARRAIEAHLHGTAFHAGDAGGELAERRGVFVTLRRRADGELRGCIGFVEPQDCLASAVARAAAAALEDYRFDPVRIQELPLLDLEISVLGVPWAIQPEEVQVGTHGLIVRHAGRGGLLLPQVARARRWDRETFLDQACRKAGLPVDTWRRPDCEVLAFTALVLAETSRG